MNFRSATLAALVCIVFLGERGGAQNGPPLFTSDSNFGTFHVESTLPRGGEVYLVGDVALVRVAGVVYVFDRAPGSNDWQEGSPLTLPADLGRMDFDGRQVIFGDDGEARIYRRNARGAWHETAVLTSDDGNPHLGTSVAIDGRHAIVGAVTGEPSPTDNDHAYIFRRDSGVWHQVTVLSSTISPQGRRQKAGFGRQVDIDGDVAIVQESLFYSPTYIYERNQGGSDNWGEVKIIGGFEGAGDIAIGGDTVAFGSGEAGFALVTIADRDEGGLGNWGEQGFVTSGLPPTIISIDGNLLSVGSVLLPSQQPAQLGVDVLARNQGLIPAPPPAEPGRASWNRIARLVAPGPSTGPMVVGLALNGDTLMISPPRSNVTYVLVSDLDGDGTRDGVDPCPRDPLDNTAGGCRRDSSLYPNLDDHLTLTSYSESAPAINRRVGTATYTNSSNTPIRNPFFELTEINGRNLLINADEGPAGVGATLSPDVGDGVLSPGETMTVEFVIRYRSRREPLAFTVVFRGEESD